MAEEPEKKEGVIQETAEAVKGVLQAVPIYQDALQPLAKETGKALGTLGRAVNTALLPLRAMIWGFDQMEDFFRRDVAEKFNGVSEEKIVTPDATIAVPAIEALRYAGGKDSLRNLYAGLLAGAMNSDTVDDAHPAYVEVLRQLSAQDATNLRYFEDGLFVYIVMVMVTDEEIPDTETERLRAGITSFEADGGGDFLIVGRGASSRKYKSVLVDSRKRNDFASNLKRLGLIDIMFRPGETAVPYYNLPEDDLIVANDKRIADTGKYPLNYCSVYRLDSFGTSFMKACGLCPYGSRPIDARLKSMQEE